MPGERAAERRRTDSIVTEAFAALDPGEYREGLCKVHVRDRVKTPYGGT